MSLWWRRRAIARAVAGDLDPGALRDLLVHLPVCSPCRDFYDRLALTADAVAGGTSRAAITRERLMVEAAFDREAGQTPLRARFSLRHVAWFSALAVPAVVALVVLVRSNAPLTVARSEDPNAPAGTTYRGTAEEDASPPMHLLVHASRKASDGKAGPVRLVADLPAAGEGRVSLGEYMQFSARGLSRAAFVVVLGLDEQGQLHRYLPSQDGAALRIEATSGAGSLGPSVDLSVGHRAGRLRVCAAVAETPLDVEAAVALLRRAQGGTAGGRLPGVRLLCGVLLVQP